MTKKVYFITKNKYKLKAMQESLGRYDISVENIAIETPEIQSTDCEEVAKFSAKYIAEKLGKPVLKADAGLFIQSLGDLPGVYTSDFQKKLGAKKVLKLMEDEENRDARIVYSLAYCEPGKEPISFKTGSDGTISHNIQGEEGMLIDFLFVPKDYNETLGVIKSK
ncbi:MAG: non-canonical purine NTP pyrophosphatase, partial [Candidatus Nanoarchaeia archaeon]|nr:non-canonical purine NTP pyrophosphatase [Candidatus Nanoarchaeia archaeon]